MACFIRFDSTVIVFAFVTVASPSVGYSASFEIVSDVGNGVLADTPSTSTQATDASATSVRVGNVGSFPDRTNVNAIYFFELPDFGGSSVMDAELQFPYIDAENDFSALDMDE